MLDPRAYEHLFIDGRQVSPAAGRLFDNIDPTTEEPIGWAPDADVEDVRGALRAARAAFDRGVWSAVRRAERARVMRQIADAVERHAAEVVELTLAEIGHPTWVAAGFAQTALANARYVAELAGRDFGYSAPPVVGDRKVSTRLVVREPVGVVSALLPFNA